MSDQRTFIGTDVLVGGLVGIAVGAYVAIPLTPNRSALSTPLESNALGGCQTGGVGGGVGMAEGAAVLDVGKADGAGVGRLVGIAEGVSVGTADGTTVGEDVGLDVAALYL